MLRKNDHYNVRISGCTSQGLGVARIDHMAVFIKGAIPGELCEIQIVKIGKTKCYGRLVQVLEPSSHRILPDCPYYGKCGGCAFRHMTYTMETALKLERVRDAITRIGGIDPGDLSILPAPSPSRYRNKVQFPVASVDGKSEAGFFRSRSHDLIPVSDCLIQPYIAGEISQAILQWMRRYHILPYDEATGTGYIRHIFIRQGAVTGQIMVCLVVNSDYLPKSSQLVSSLLSQFPKITTIVHNVNIQKGNVILGAVYHPLFGSGTIEDILCGLSFQLSPASFYQVNHAQAEILYREAIRLANIQKTETVLDLYCGTGTITLIMSQYAQKVIGIEVVQSAISDARNNAVQNNIDNAQFICADAGTAALKLASDGIRIDTIVLDPPRKGISSDVIQAISLIAPSKIIYISCDPATLARDLHLLQDYDYKFLRGTAIDLFPRCAHVETVCCLYHHKKDFISVPYEPKDTEYLEKIK